MHRSLKIAGLIVFALWSLMAPAGAQSCAGLVKSMGISPDALVDGTTYVRVPKQSTGPSRHTEAWQWQPLATVASLGVSRPVSGLYVVRDMSERVGVVVIKTGRFGPVTNPAAARTVTLKRDAGGCSTVGLNSSVPSEVYDGFHDFGYQNYETVHLSTIHNFHVAYGKDCKQRTDDDPGGFFRHVSNRASFSFTPDVVDYGGYTGVDATIAKIGFGRVAQAQRAITPEIGFSSRQAEIRSYATTTGLACIPVTIPYADQGSFFRTNDLAGQMIGSVREKRY